MKRILKISMVAGALLAGISYPLQAQGNVTFIGSPSPATFEGIISFSNGRAPTRLYSIDGPLAGPGIWAQMFYSKTPIDLQPIGSPREHFSNGTIYGGHLYVTVDDILAPVYVQIVAWDGALWGTSLEGVPEDQLGHTDVVPYQLGYGSLPPDAPFFKQSAVVPIPEPSAMLLAALSFGFLVVQRSRCRPLR